MSVRLVRRDDLTSSETDALFGLLRRHFEGISRRRFALDLAEKQWVLIQEVDGVIQGFSTLLMYETVMPLIGRTTVVCSGDTVTAAGARGTSSLPRGWIAAVRELHRRHAGGRLLWLLLTSGFRTYRFLPVFYREFWPRHDRPTPGGIKETMDLMSAQRWGSSYLSDPGIVRFPEPQVLRSGPSDIRPGRLSDPHVAFFLELNPGWRNGDELVCLTEIAEGNLTDAGRRMWHEAGVGAAT